MHFRKTVKARGGWSLPARDIKKACLMSLLGGFVFFGSFNKHIWSGKNNSHSFLFPVHIKAKFYTGC